MKKLKLSVFFLIILTYLTACNGKSTAKEEKTSVDTASTKLDSAKTTETASTSNSDVAYDKKYDELAKVIAGMPVDSSSEYYYLTKTASWKRYAKTMDSSWSKLENDRLEKIRTWRDVELKDVSIEGKDLFYPFSGPDFVHGYNFFNKADNIYMFGLEGVGSLPQVSKKSEKDMTNYYNSIQKYLGDVMSKSYFITKKMLAGLYQVNGMTPIICVFMARTGNTVVKVQPMKLSNEGKMVEFDTTGLSKKEKAAFKAVRIDFLDKDTKKLKSVYYYSGDLADYAFDEKSPIYKYLNNMPEGCNGMLKSASYLLLGKNFSKVRNAMLARCKNILQDDTGVGYTYYDKTQWSFTFYGVYAKPIGDFPWAEQTDLKKAYKDKSNTIKPLPFGIGYHWMNRQDNLILAVKK